MSSDQVSTARAGCAEERSARLNLALNTPTCLPPKKIQGPPSVTEEKGRKGRHEGLNRNSDRPSLAVQPPIS